MLVHCIDTYDLLAVKLQFDLQSDLGVIGCVQGSPIGHQTLLPSATDGTIGNPWYQLTLMIFYRH